MDMALELAKQARPSPNPQVGAVIVKDGNVIGKGFHTRPGAPHAEIIAIDDAGDAVRGADLYVTLEPCAHQGRTGPCVDAILRAGITGVAIGIADPDPRVNGTGIAKLEAAGITVSHGVRKAACASLLRSYITHRQHGRPHVTLKAAITLDGYLATTSGDSRWISSKPSRTIAHEMRAMNDAILVGANTVARDNPDLTVRHVPGKNPLRIVLDSNLRTSTEQRLITGAVETPTLIVHTTGDRQKILPFQSLMGIETMRCTRSENGVDLRDLLSKLAKKGILSLLVEGGAAIHSAFIESGLVDELVLFIAPKILGNGRSFVSLSPVKAIADGIQLDTPNIQLSGPDIVYRTTFTARDKNR